MADSKFPETAEDTPKYARIRESLLQYIHENRLHDGDKLPTERFLAEHYGVSRITIQRAIRELQDENLLYRIQGGGTYVGAKRPGLAYQEETPPKTPSFLPFIFTQTDEISRAFEIIQGAESYLKQESCYLTVHTTPNDVESRRAIIEELLRSQAKCILIEPAADDVSVDLYFDLIRRGIHLVFVDVLPKDINGNFVTSDNISGGYIATRHLLEQGCRRIVFFGSDPAQASSVADRLRGYKHALREAGLPIQKQYIRTVHFGQGEGSAEQAIAELYGASEPPDGFFAVNDITAFYLQQLLLQKGLRIPEDAALIGFDNLRDAASQPSPLSTVNQEFFQIGYRAAEMCMDLIKNGSIGFRHLFLPVSLVARQSSQRPHALL